MPSDPCEPSAPWWGITCWDPELPPRERRFSQVNLWNNGLNCGDLGLPNSLGNIDKAFVVWFGANALGGVLPNSAGRLTDVVSLDFSNCEIEGEVPGTLGDLANAQFIYLSNNNFTGFFPPALCKSGPNRGRGCSAMNNQFWCPVPHGCCEIEESVCPAGSHVNCLLMCLAGDEDYDQCIDNCGKCC